MVKVKLMATWASKWVIILVCLLAKITLKSYNGVKGCCYTHLTQHLAQKYQ